VSGREVELSVHLDGRRDRVRWSLPSGHTASEDDAADAALTATLLVAMARDEALTLEAPISARLDLQVPLIQDIFATWARHSQLMRGLPPGFRRVSVEAGARPAPSHHGRATGVGRSACFFSGGLDSFTSALAHRDEDLTLVYVHGLDVPLHDTARRERFSAVVRHAAATLGLALVEVETDVRAFTDHDVDWLDGHGAALAGIAMLLGSAFSRVYVPATDTYATLVTLGSHPLVDPLWSTERVELVHDGARYTRIDKLRIIDAEPIARETLRVCVRDGIGEFNCGRCWKCVLTMVGVHSLGIADRFSTLPDLGERELLRRVAEPAPDVAVRSWDRHRMLWVPYLAAAEEHLGAASRRRLEAALALRYARSRARTETGKIRQATTRNIGRLRGAHSGTGS